MSPSKKLAETAILEQYRVALENATSQEQIAEMLAEFGYGAKKIEEGKKLLSETKEAYYFNKTEDDETKAARYDFDNKKQKLETIYNLHRKKAKIVFNNDALTANKLAITGTKPQAYINWLETTKKFYAVALAESSIQEKLARLKITESELSSAQSQIEALEKARAEYLREVGESQDATKIKDQAFAKMCNWMSEFYAVAKIALEDHPQLLEALLKQVKS